MVNKTVRCGQRTGNSIKTHVWRNICSSRDAYVEMEIDQGDIDILDIGNIEYTMSEFSDGIHGTPKSMEPWDELFVSGDGENGSLQNNMEVLFSLNKRKRWLLQDTVKARAYELCKEEFKVVLAWRRQVLVLKNKCEYDLVNVYLQQNDCSEYMDSSKLIKMHLPNKTFANFLDLKRKSDEIEEEEPRRMRRRKVSMSMISNFLDYKRKSNKTEEEILKMLLERRKDPPIKYLSKMRTHEIQRQRGIQRPMELFWQRVQLYDLQLPSDDVRPQYDQKQPSFDNQLTLGPVTSLPEIRYIHWGPAVVTSHFHPQHMYNWRFVRSREFRKYSGVRKQHYSKKGQSKQKGCVNGRKVKHWQKWDREDLGHHVQLASVIQTNSSQRTIGAQSGVNKLDDGFKLGGSDINRLRDDDFTGKAKSPIQVNMADLIKGCKKREPHRLNNKRWIFKTKKGPEEIHIGVRNAKIHTSSVWDHWDVAKRQREETDLKEIDNNNLRREETNEKYDRDNEQTSIFCQLLKSEFFEFMARSYVRRSGSCFPPLVFISLRQNSTKNGNIFSADTYLQPGLVVQEMLHPASYDPSEQIGDYILKVHAEIDNDQQKLIREEISKYVTSSKPSPASLRKIYSLAQNLLKSRNNGDKYMYQHQTEGASMYLSKVDKPLFDWMTTITYRISTIDHIYRIHFHKSEKKSSSKETLSLLEFFDDDSKKCAVCLTSLAGNGAKLNGICVLPCEHVFCRNCVYRNIVEMIEQGTQPIPCLEHGCKSEIDEIMIMSLVPFEMFRSWDKAYRERTVMSTGRWTLCPNDQCTHIVSVSERATNDMENPSPKTLSSRREVTCVCKIQFCVDCREPPHWPTTCLQAETYHKITSHVLGTCSVSVNENESFLLKVNSCPRCREKINKHSSRVITCKCGNYFCWDCLRPVADHKVGDICGKLSQEDLDSSTRMVLTLPSHNIEKAVFYRLMQMRLLNWKKNKSRIFTKFRLLVGTENLAQSPRPQQGVESRTNAFHSLSIFIKTLKVLEYIYVSIPPIPKGFYSRQLTKMHDVGNKTDFIITRMEQLLMNPVQHSERQKIRTFQNLLSDNLCDLYLLSMWTRKGLLDSGQWADTAENVRLAKLLHVFPSARRKTEKS